VDIQSRIEQQAKIDSLAIGLSSETSVYDYLFAKALADNAISYLPVAENLSKTALLNVSESFKVFAEKKNLKLLYIQNDAAFWEGLMGTKEFQNPEILGVDDLKVQEKLTELKAGNLAFSAIFDIKKLANYYALLNLYSNRVENSLYLNFNQKTDLFEPYHVDKELESIESFYNHQNSANSI